MERRSSTVRVQLKYGKRTMRTVLDRRGTGKDFKRSVESLINVRWHRIQLFSRGSGGWRGKLRDDQRLSSLDLYDDMVVVASGTNQRSARSSRDRTLVGLSAAAAASVLAALVRGSFLVTYVGCMSLVTLLAFGYDKLAAKISGRPHHRVPERTLLFLSATGGFPGAVAGMLLFVHKIGKPRFLLSMVKVLAVNLVLLYQACQWGWLAAS